MVRGSALLRRRQVRLPLTPALSPQAGERGIGVQ